MERIHFELLLAKRSMRTRTNWCNARARALYAGTRIFFYFISTVCMRVKQSQWALQGQGVFTQQCIDVRRSFARYNISSETGRCQSMCMLLLLYHNARNAVQIDRTVGSLHLSGSFLEQINHLSGLREAMRAVNIWRFVEQIPAEIYA